MKKFIFIVIALFVVMLFTGCALTEKIVKAEKENLTITKIVACGKEPEGYRDYAELKSTIFPPYTYFWVYIEYKGLSIEPRDVSLDMTVESGEYTKTGNIFRTIESTVGENGTNLKGELGNNGWITLKMWGGYNICRYTLTYTINDYITGMMAKKSIEFEVTNIRNI